MYLCDICTSPFRLEIDTALRNHEMMIRVIRRYKDKFGVKLEETFRKRLQTHAKHMNRNAEGLVVIESQPGVGARRATLEKFAQKLLEIGDKRLDEHPERVTIPDVIQAQRLLIERSRVKVQEDSLRLAVAKMFGGVGPGPTEPIEAIEEPAPSLLSGEEVQDAISSQDTAAGV
ncbi:MAG: hypothetical protein HY589_04140 [Candidatus Omnitrophica bacterium]|nr:hypothetical protein [Candidatus Omnitrophota bacterium]